MPARMNLCIESSRQQKGVAFSWAKLTMPMPLLPKSNWRLSFQNCDVFLTQGFNAYDACTTCPVFNNPRIPAPMFPVNRSMDDIFSPKHCCLAGTCNRKAALKRNIDLVHN